MRCWARTWSGGGVSRGSEHERRRLASRLNSVHAQQRAAISSEGIVVLGLAPVGQGGLGRIAEEVVDAGVSQDALELVIGPRTNGCAPHPAWVHGHRFATAPSDAGDTGDQGCSRPKSGGQFILVRLGSAPRGPVNAWSDLWAFAGTGDPPSRNAHRRASGKVVLVAANSHLQFARAASPGCRGLPSGAAMGSERAVGRHVADYQQADVIATISEYVWESFVDNGVPEERLIRFPLTPHPRYLTATRQPSETREHRVRRQSDGPQGCPRLVGRHASHSGSRCPAASCWRLGDTRNAETRRGADGR